MGSHAQVEQRVSSLHENGRVGKRFATITTSFPRLVDITIRRPTDALLDPCSLLVGASVQTQTALAFDLIAPLRDDLLDEPGHPTLLP